jgi:RHS repeat-associated protein
MTRSRTALFVVFLMAALRGWAICETNGASRPSVQIGSAQVAPNGDISVPVSYNFPNTDYYLQRELHLFIAGIAYTPPFPLDANGTWVVDSNVSCLPTGTHGLFATAHSCGRNDNDHYAEAQSAFSVNTTPSASLSMSGPDVAGKTRAIVGFNFPNTRDWQQRRIELYGSNGLHLTHAPGEQQGVWTSEEFQSACATFFTVFATACGQFSVDDSVTPEDKKPEIKTLSVVKVGMSGETAVMEVTLEYDLKNPNGQVKVELDNWVNADGVAVPGYALATYTAPSDVQSGAKVFTFDAPTGSQTVAVKATATTACGVTKKAAGAECETCPGATANPVYLSDGNMRLTDLERLPPVARRSLVRTYNSEEQVIALFGRGWTSLLDRRLITHTDGVSITTETNEVVRFRNEGGTWLQIHPTSRRALGRLTRDASAATYSYRPPGATEVAVFRASDGRLIALRDVAASQEAVVVYDGQGRPASLTDVVTEVTWQFTYDGANRRIATVSVAGHPGVVWSYAYDGNGNLTTVLAPGGAVWRTYEYAANRMTASRDALGNLIESHTYDSSGFAIDSTGDVDEIANIQYRLPGSSPLERVTRVTYKTGAISEHRLRPVGAAWRTVEVTGGCASCGTHDATYVHDDRGRVIRAQGADGYVTVTAYSGDRVAFEEQSLKPAGCDPDTHPQRCRLGMAALAAATLQSTTATARTTYEHNDPLWPDKVTAVVRPSVSAAGQVRRETYQYHAFTGAVVNATVCGWSPGGSACSGRTTATTFYEGSGAAFDPGGAFQSAWLALPQPAYAVKSVDGPRGDVQDVSTLVYYPIDSSVPALLRGRLAASQNAAGHIVRYEDHDVFGNARRVVEPNGTASESTYDALGRQLTSTVKGLPGCNTTLDPLCATDLTFTREYMGAGPLRLEQRPGGGVSLYTYDARGRLLTISRGPGELDLRERIETTYAPLTGKKSLERTLAYEGGSWVEKRRQAFAYDDHARLQTVTHADGAAIHYAYDSVDRMSTIRDENHAAPNTAYRYDPAGRLASVTQTLSGAAGGAITTHYTYDVAGNLTSVADPNGNVTVYTYDDFGQMSSQQSPVTGMTTYQYDGAGNLTSTTDANAATSTRTYDLLDRVITSTSNRGSVVLNEIVAWSYDDATPGRFSIGRPSSMADPSGTTTYAYNRYGSLREERRTFGPTPGTHTTAYRYDADGNRSRIVYPSGRIVDYTYDFAGRPRTVATGGASIVTSTSYLPFGPPKEIVMGNGTTRTTTYDHRYRPLTNVLTGAGGTIASYGYGHDAAGNITSINDALDSGYNRSFAYDDLNRLTTANSGSSLWGTGSFAYDRMGNLLSSSLGTRNKAFAYVGTTPKLASVSDGASRAVTYDAAGNEVGVGSTVYRYSPRNLLGSLSYDVIGRDWYDFDGRGVRTSMRAQEPIWILDFSVDRREGGVEIEGRIVLANPAPAGGAHVSLHSGVEDLAVPAVVVVPEGQTAATFSAQLDPSATPLADIPVTASWRLFSQTGLVYLEWLVQLEFQDGALSSGMSTTGTVTIDNPAGPEGAIVVLETDQPSLLVLPASVTVPPGATEVSFDATFTGSVSVITEAMVSASSGTSDLQVSLQLLPPEVASVTLDPSTVEGGQEVVATVTLDSPAAAGTEVGLTATGDAVESPASVAISAGATTGQTSLSTDFVPTQETSIITATLEPRHATAPLTITPLASTLQSIVLDPSSVHGTGNAVLTVVLTAPAPPGGLQVELVGGTGCPVEHAPFVTIPAGEIGIEVPIHTDLPEECDGATIQAHHGLTTLTELLDILPPADRHLSSLTLPSGLLAGGDQATATIRMSEAAPVVTRIAVMSSEPDIAAVPTRAAVASGQLEATFNVNTEAVVVPVDVTITASFETVTRRFLLTILPSADTVVIDDVVIDPPVIGGAPLAGTVTLSGPAPVGGAMVTLTGSRAGVATVPPSVLVPEGDTGASFLVLTQNVGYARGLLVTATYGSISRTASAAVLPGAPLRRNDRITSSSQSVIARGSVRGQATTRGIAVNRLNDVIRSIDEYYFYTPELNLLADAWKDSDTVFRVGSDYIWFGGQPIAQIANATEEIAWYFNDHLGTPILQTDQAAMVVWRVERAPYGEVVTYRAGGSRNQPLAFPGQEDRGELSYNIFRWYRSGWGRYTQADPIAVGGTGMWSPPMRRVFSARDVYSKPMRAIAGLPADSVDDPYAYVGANPLRFVDPLGLEKFLCEVVAKSKTPLIKMNPSGSAAIGMCIYNGTCQGPNNLIAIASDVQLLSTPPCDECYDMCYYVWDSDTDSRVIVKCMWKWWKYLWPFGD